MDEPCGDVLITILKQQKLVGDEVIKSCISVLVQFEVNIRIYQQEKEVNARKYQASHRRKKSDIILSKCT